MQRRWRRVVFAQVMLSHVAVATAVMHNVLQFLVTKRRNSWACRGNPNPEQETIKGTHTQETPAFRGLQGFQGPATQPTKLFCTFGGFLLSFLNAYAFLAIVSLCNNQNKAVTIDKAAKFSGAPR